MKTKHIFGLHHITALASDPARNADFHTRVLGQRLVKKTVNFDDPGTYHLYYADAEGTPGTVLTFFPIPGIRRGRAGTGSISHTAWAIPQGSLGFWKERLKSLGINHEIPFERFGQKGIGFEDPDGMLLELIESNHLPAVPWQTQEIDEPNTLRGFHSATATVSNNEPTANLLQKLGYVLIGTEGNRSRYGSTEDSSFGFLDILKVKDQPRALQGGGSVHHIAFATPDDDQQLKTLTFLREQQVNVSPVRDRQYFHSIYFNEPNGILFEIATNPPGFSVDESTEALGQNLQLPPQYEAHRDLITSNLPSLEIK